MRRQGELRVPIPLLGGGSSSESRPADGRKLPTLDVFADHCQKLLQEAMDNVQEAWATLEDGASLDEARPQVVKATAALIGLHRELSRLKRKKK
jgi:hypothetical protein